MIHKILPNTIYNFDNSDINIEGVKFFHTTQFLTILCLYKKKSTHDCLAFS